MTSEQLEEDLKIVAKNSDKNEKLAWVRKKKKMEDLIESLRPIEDAILELVAQKQPIMDEITQLRAVMCKECIHPEEFLAHHGDFINCKFCNSRLKLNRPIVNSNG